MNKLIIIFLALYTTPSSYSGVFQDINKNPIVLSDEIIKVIDEELIGKKSKSNSLKVNLKLPKEFIANENLSKNMCYRINIFGNDDKSPLSAYSNAKFDIPKIADNKIKFPVKNAPNSIQISFDMKGYYSSNIYLGNSRGVDVDCIDIEIPLIALDAAEALTDNQSGILVKKESLIEEVFIDDDSQVKMFLDDEMKKVPFRSRGSAKYIYYKDLKPGNTMIKLAIKDKGFINEIIHLIANEVTIIDDRFSEKNNLGVSFFKNKPLGINEEPFDLMKKLKSGLSENIESTLVKSVSKINTIKRQHSKLLVHNDLEINGKNLYYSFGLNDQKVVIPSDEYAKIFFETNNIDVDDDFCVLELKLNKGTSKIYASNSNGETIDAPDIIIKDKYGNMSGRVNKNADLAYLVGYLGGVIDYQIVYEDGLSQFGQVPCSSNSYIIEQLL